MLVKVSYIDWDTDGEDVDLPSQLLIPVPEHVDTEDVDEVEDYIADTISEDTGFSHKGFGYDIIGD